MRGRKRKRKIGKESLDARIVTTTAMFSCSDVNVNVNVNEERTAQRDDYDCKKCNICKNRRGPNAGLRTSNDADGTSTVEKKGGLNARRADAQEIPVSQAARLSSVLRTWENPAMRVSQDQNEQDGSGSRPDLGVRRRMKDGGRICGDD